MPPKTKIGRNAIIEAALELVRERGHEALSARALAERLGCSTQPLLYQFPSMAELRRAVYDAADACHTRSILDGVEEAPHPLLALGLNYVRFGREEPNLFRFLFQSAALGDADVMSLMDDERAGPLVELVAANTQMSAHDARGVFLALFASAHGLASLLANNALVCDDELVSQVLTGAFEGAVALQGRSYDESAR